MDGHFPLKMKRKDLDDVNDDFSDFSLSSPARKIRRLDAELPPIIEEEECEIPIRSEQSVPYEQSLVTYSGGIRIEELPSENEEKAIVHFNPMNNPLTKAPSNLSMSVHPGLISGLKNQVICSNQSNSWRLTDEDREKEDISLSSSNGYLAVVPYVPSRLPEVPETDNFEMMDAEESEVATMEVEEEDNMGIDQRIISGSDDHLHQWQQQQQQHCMIPQAPYNATTPIVWYQ